MARAQAPQRRVEKSREVSIGSNEGLNEGSMKVLAKVTDESRESGVRAGKKFQSFTNPRRSEGDSPRERPIIRAFHACGVGPWQVTVGLEVVKTNGIVEEFILEEMKMY